MLCWGGEGGLPRQSQPLDGLCEKKIEKLRKVSELTSPFRLLTGEILPSGWAVCLQKKKETKGVGEPYSASHFNTTDF